VDRECLVARPHITMQHSALIERAIYHLGILDFDWVWSLDGMWVTSLGGEGREG
jgi:hypothetical protein